MLLGGQASAVVESGAESENANARTKVTTVKMRRMDIRWVLPKPHRLCFQARSRTVAASTADVKD